MRTVTSSDGTPIAFEQSGTGPNLVLVHGTGTFMAPWASIFAPHFTVVAMDRRGRGDSGDAPAYAIEREFDDIVAVAAVLEPPVLLFGHSYGALCALGAAMRTDRLSALVLYEPSLPEGEHLYDPDALTMLDALVAGGDQRGAMKAFYMGIVGMSDEEAEGFLNAPAGPRRIATAPTLVRELRAEKAFRLDRAAAARLTTPVLLIRGGDSPPDLTRDIPKLETALPNARTAILPGQGHLAMYTAPDLLVGAVLQFWYEIRVA